MYEVEFFVIQNGQCYVPINIIMFLKWDKV